MQVLGLTFTWSIEGFTLMWEPAEQFHIHSPGGRTIGKHVDEKEIRPDEHYHFTQAAKKEKQKGRKLVENRTLLWRHCKKNNWSGAKAAPLNMKVECRRSPKSVEI
jgi:hypothetical protein